MTGVMIAWWVLTVPSVIFVAIDIWRSTPEATAMKWAFVVMTVFAGPVGAFFYVLGCREPLPGTHEAYTAARWRQALGSTMHCAAGDGLGIIAGSAVGAAISLGYLPGIALEYVLGFGFGWTFFQAFAMRDMAGGDYLKSLKMTFFPEFVSMNMLMSGMVLSHMVGVSLLPGAEDPSNPEFWFVMSMALIVGFVVAYPMNWWLVARHLKHGMITVRPKAEVPAGAGHDGMPGMGGEGTAGMGGAEMAGMVHSSGSSHDGGTAHKENGSPTSMGASDRGTKAAMVVVSVAVLVVSLWIAPHIM